MDETAFFSILDYVIFGGMLLVSAVIGIYFAYFAKQKQDNTLEYLMGGKTMGVFPIAMSLIASNISGTSLMGLPAEIYTFGTLIALLVVSEPLAYFFGAFTTLPVLHDLNITSSYEYLERRFNVKLRKLGSILFLIGNMLYVPVVIYIPALALSQISGLSLTILIPLVCTVCTFYTTLGGLKAVVWTDTFQTIIIIIGVITVAIVGTVNVGGFWEVWNRNYDTGRIEIFNMDIDPTLRHTFWTVFVGKFFSNLSFSAVNQAMVQRYIALPTVRKARISILIMSIGVVAIVLVCCYSGLVIYAAFHGCDPLTAGYVRKSDGMMPYFVMKFTRHIPALPGIFIAGVFSAALSSLSTCQNSMCGVLFEDFIRPYISKSTSEARCSFYMKIIVVIIGIITTILASVVDKLGGIVQTSSSLSGITLGPLYGFFILGMFIPYSTGQGALVGGVIATSVVGYICFGAQYAISRKRIVYPWKPVSMDSCDNTTMAMYFAKLNATLANPITQPDEPWAIFRLSYLYYAPVGILITVTVGLLTSWITGFQDVSKIEGNLLHPSLRPYFNTRDKVEKQVKNDMYEIRNLLVH